MLDLHMLLPLPQATASQHNTLDTLSKVPAVWQPASKPQRARKEGDMPSSRAGANGPWRSASPSSPSSVLCRCRRAPWRTGVSLSPARDACLCEDTSEPYQARAGLCSLPCRAACLSEARSPRRDQAVRSPAARRHSMTSGRRPDRQGEVVLSQTSVCATAGLQDRLGRQGGLSRARVCTCFC